MLQTIRDIICIPSFIKTAKSYSQKIYNNGTLPSNVNSILLILFQIQTKLFAKFLRSRGDRQTKRQRGDQT